MAVAPSILARNWRLKVSALAMSVFLWALVQTEPRNQETFSDVPVRVEIQDTLWTVARPPTPSTVELRMGGPAGEIIRLAREGTTLRVPIQSVGSSDTVVELRREWVELGQRNGLIVESVSPASLELSFEEVLTRTIPVAMRFQGRLSSDLSLASPISLTPARVRVSGAATRVEAMDSVLLEAFDLAALMRSGRFVVAVDTAGMGGGVVTPGAATLDILVEESMERLFAELPVGIGTVEGEGELVSNPSSVELRLSGARTLVSAVDPTTLSLSVAPEFVAGLVEGESRRVPLRVSGVPPLIAAVPGTPFVTIRRAADLPDAPAGAGGP